ncbi:MAG TPA: GNAT family N-acetyltransferase, partial [Solirubrobacteraceae bacterium]|nr:GNAT family N-acetyltransferase [Solirubrobacteraceae bacterium]
MDDLTAAFEFERRITRRGAARWTELPLGWEARHDRLADVYHLNALLLRAPLPAEVSAAELTALVEDRQRDLRHRRVVLDDEHAGERLADALLDAGWERDRTLYMALGADPQDALIDPRARVLSEEQLRAVQHATLGEDDVGPNTSPGLIDRLVEAQAALRAGTRALGFGAGQGEPVVSHCTLFCEAEPTDRRVAMIDSVGTLRAHRQQGLAKAVVSAAVRAAGEWGADLIVVPADADDWPQLLYAGLGFVPL